MSADANVIGIGPLQSRQVAALDLEHGDIGIGVGAQQFGAKAAAVRERDGDGLGVFDDVTVGDDEAAPINDDARTQRLRAAVGFAQRPPAEFATEEVPHRVLEDAAPHHALRADVDDGGRDLARDLRVGRGERRQIVGVADGLSLGRFVELRGALHAGSGNKRERGSADKRGHKARRTVRVFHGILSVRQFVRRQGRQETRKTGGGGERGAPRRFSPTPAL